MKNKHRDLDESKVDNSSPYKVKIPGFILDKEIGLGDIIKKTTTYFGIRPCGICEHRATALNQWIVFTSQKSK